jgi:hypothetical protein
MDSFAPNLESFAMQRYFLTTVFSFLLVAAASLQSCATQGVTISSVPSEAEVYGVKQNGERSSLLGKTPFKVNEKDGIGFEIVKNGFASTIALLPDAQLPRRQVYFVALAPISKEWLSKAVVGGNTEILSASVSELMDFQRFIQDKKLSDAELFIKTNLEKFKSVSVFHILSGHLFYSKKDYSKAKEHFSIATTLDPKNEEPKEMLNLLKNLTK